MGINEILTNLVALLALGIAVTRWLYFIQLKEYRADRFIDFIRYDKGRRQLFKPYLILPYILITIVAIIDLKISTPILIWLYMTGQIIYALHEALYRFKKTFKALVIFAITFILSSLILTFSSSLWAIALSPLVLALVVFMMNLVFKFEKERIIKKAAKKISGYPNLKIIGVTGSYGKSSVKEFAATILSEKFKVLKTPENTNTDIGVAQLILKTDLSQYEIFVVEMGAYRIGEIRNICKITKPDIAIIAAIGEEHLSLFGSLENIGIGKGEIFEELKPQGLAITNADNPGCVEIIERLGVEAETYGQLGSAKHRIDNVKTVEDEVTFNFDDQNYRADVFGEHQVYNLCAAIIAAQHFGLSEDQIKSGLSKVKTRDQTLKLKHGRHGVMILDDSYNSNPTGFKAAIDSAHKINIKGRKYLVTMGMMELGRIQKAAHEEIAHKAEPVFDHIILTRCEIKPYFENIIHHEKLAHIEKSHDIIHFFLEQDLTEHDLILIENRVPDQLYKYLLAQT